MKGRYISQTIGLAIWAGSFLLLQYFVHINLSVEGFEWLWFLQCVAFSFMGWFAYYDGYHDGLSEFVPRAEDTSVQHTE